MRKEFSKSVRLAAWKRCGERCECHRLPNWKPTCNRERIIGVADYHHIIEAAVGGSNDLDNCAVLSPKCHRLVTIQQSVPQVSKTQRIIEKRAGVRTGRGFPKHRDPWGKGRDA